MTKTDPFKVPKWKKVLEANDPQQFKAKSPVPLLIIQGGERRADPARVDEDPRQPPLRPAARSSSGGSTRARATPA